jgi:hypothetical protein
MSEETKLSLEEENKKLKEVLHSLHCCLVCGPIADNAEIVENCMNMIHENFTDEEIADWTEPVVLHNYYFDEEGNARHILGDNQLFNDILEADMDESDDD